MGKVIIVWSLGPNGVIWAFQYGGLVGIWQNS